MATRDLKDLIKSRHPSYDAATLMWDAYKGGASFHNYLETHKKEDPSIFQERKQKAYYLNYLKNSVNVIGDFIFKGDLIEREGLDDAFAKNVDRKGTTLNEFMIQSAIRAMARGLHFIAVDSPAVSVANLAEQRTAAQYPYLYHIDRPDMLNWALDEYGNPYWVLFRDYGMADADPFSKPDDRAFYKLWTRDEWQQIAVEYHGNKIRSVEIVNAGPNTIGVVPIKPMYGDFESDWVGGSWLCDIAHIAKALLNISSLRNNYMYETAIEQLVMPGATAEEVENFIKGPRYIIAQQNDAGNMPAIIGPTGKAAEILKGQEDDYISHIYRLLSQRITNASASADGASGTSKQVDFEVSTNTTLSGLADECERVENAIHEFRTMYDANIGEVKVKYPDDFNVAALDNSIKRAIEMDGLSLPDPVRAYNIKTIINKMVGTSEQAEKKELLDSVDQHFAELEVAETEMQAAQLEMISTPTPAVNGGQPQGSMMNA